MRKRRDQGQKPPRNKGQTHGNQEAQGLQEGYNRHSKEDRDLRVFHVAQERGAQPTKAYGNAAPNKGKIDLDKLISHYKNIGYTITVEGIPLLGIGAAHQKATV